MASVKKKTNGKAQIEPTHHRGEEPDNKAQILALKPLNENEVVGALKALEMMNSLTKTMAAVQLCHIHSLYTSNDKIPKWLVLNYGKDFKQCCARIGIPYSTAKRRVRDVHIYGMEMLQNVEVLNLPMSTLRKTEALTEEKQQQVHKFLMNGNADVDAVKQYITGLTAENARLKQHGHEELVDKNEQLEYDLEYQKRNNDDLKKEKKIRDIELQQQSPHWQASNLIKDVDRIKALFYYLLENHPETNEQLSQFREKLTTLANSV